MLVSVAAGLTVNTQTTHCLLPSKINNQMFRQAKTESREQRSVASSSSVLLQKREGKRE